MVMLLLAMHGWAQAPASDWDGLVGRLTNPLRARWSPEEARPHVVAACEAGHAAACRMVEGTSLPSALAESCTAGDWVACTGLAELQRTASPEQAYALFLTSCEAGESTACVATARARHLGEGTWLSRPTGRRQAEALCRDGTGDACIFLALIDGPDRPEAQRRHLQRAKSLGATGADERLAMLLGPGPPRDRALDAACASGGADACWERSLGNRSVGTASRACALGLPTGCVAQAALAVEHDRALVDLSPIDECCANGADACCMTAGFIRTGGRPAAFPIGALAPAETPVLAGVTRNPLLDCLRDRLGTRDAGESDVDLHLSIAADGTFLGAWTGDAEPHLGACVTRALLGRQGPAPLGGPAQVSLSWHIVQRAIIGIEPTDKTPSSLEATEARQRLAAWASDQVGTRVNRCFLDDGNSGHDEQFALYRLELGPDGRLRATAVIESSGERPDACIASLLEGLRPPDFTAPFLQEVSVRIDFNQVSTTLR